MLVEYRPSWPKFDPWLDFSAPIWVKFGQLGRYSIKIGAEIQLRAFDRFQTNFGQKILLCTL
jgi:hypothetical protein